MKDRLPSYGGQALIEGVMMRGSKNVALAMRSPDGSIVIQTESLGGIYKSWVARVPFVRGLILLWDSLVLGMRMLTISANLQGEEDEKLEGPALYGTLAVSIIIAVALFMLLPAAIGQLAESWLGWNAWWSNLLEGLSRLAIVIGYIWAVGLVPDVRRVFAYHGAEHKTINAFEAGEELTPEKVAAYSVEHPRCGTAFLLTLVLLSVILFALLGPLPPAVRLGSRILLLPLLAGAAYEYIRLTARHLGSPLVKMLVKPNLALQHLTTREPSLDMLEVSIAAFKAMYEKENDAPVPVP
ncbi:MAG TPA: DUF1385 domain-containing protein [Anaerolineaceae bacterium]|nr:DUF1385 domain-containing protein [Anaerolineaceae bacterium]HPN53290.1 DUF1385 domain-containing protein [Anaerolineaceae bacterium]